MKRLLPYILFLLFLIGSIVAIPVLLKPDRYRRDIEKALGQRLHQRVLVGRVEAGWWPPALILEDVVVPGDHEETPLVRIQRLRAPLDIAALFKLHVAPTEAVGEHATLMILRRTDGSWDFGPWITSATGVTQDPGWPLARVRLSGVECRFMDPAVGGDIVANATSATLERQGPTLHAEGTLDLGAPVTFTLDARGPFDAASWSAELRLQEAQRELAFALKGRKDGLEMDAHTAEWRADMTRLLVAFYSRVPLKPVPTADIFTNGTVHFTVSASSTTFEQTASLGGGVTQAKGWMRRVPVPLAHLELAGQKVPMEAVERFLGQPVAWTGSATGILTAEMEPSTNTLASFTGSGAFDVQAGVYHWPPPAIKSLSKAHTMAYLRKKFPGFEDQGLPFNRLTWRFRAQKGQLRLETFKLELADIRVGAAGKLDLPRRGIDAYVQLNIREKSPALLKYVPAKYRDGSRIQPLYGRLQGAPEEWTLRAAPSSKIPAGIRRQLSASTGR